MCSSQAALLDSKLLEGLFIATIRKLGDHQLAWSCPKRILSNQP